MNKPTFRLPTPVTSLILCGVLIAGCGQADVTGASAAPDGDQVATITAEALQKRLQADADKPLLVDVREPAEFEAGHIQGALLAPLGTVEKDLEKVDKNREIVLVCRSGRRSGKAYKALAARGYTSLQNMEGGMLAWQKLGYGVSKGK